MHKLISKEYNKITDIYSKEKPDFLVNFFKAEVMERLSDISQNCGTELSKFYNYKINISRLEHSLGVALIIWNFTKDKRQTLSGLFHDVSHSVFSHVGDFVLGDAVNQESSEQYTEKLLKEDKVIVSELKKLAIGLDDVKDYEKYPIADNPGPKLSADRLEYTLSSAIAFDSMSNDEIKDIYDNIVILKNEDNIDELGFNNIKTAEKLGLLSVDNDETCFSSYESTVAMSFLSEIIKELLKEKIVSNYDLYKLKDSDIINIIKTTKNKKIIDMWNFYTNLSTYKIDRKKPKTDKYSISSDCKRRYIDPLIKTNNGNIRLSKLSKKFSDAKNYHLNRKEEWITLDYKISKK